MTNGNEAEAEKFLMDNGVNASAKRVLTLREKSAKKVFGTLGQDRMSSLRKRMSSVHEQKRGNMTQLFLNSLDIYDFDAIINDERNPVVADNAIVEYYKANLMAIDDAYETSGNQETDRNAIVSFYQAFLDLVMFGYPIELFSESVISVENGTDYVLRELGLIRSIEPSLRENFQGGGNAVIGFIVRGDDQSETRVIIDADVRIKDILRVTLALHRNEDSPMPAQPFRMLRPDSRTHGEDRDSTLADFIDPSDSVLPYDDQALAVLYGMHTLPLNESDGFKWIINGIDGMIINPVPGIDLAELADESGLDPDDYIQKMVKLANSDQAVVTRNFYSGPTKWFAFDDINGLVQKLTDDPSLMSIKLEDVASPVTDPSKLIQTL